jgi:hypothetical protein
MHNKYLLWWKQAKLCDCPALPTLYTSSHCLCTACLLPVVPRALTIYVSFVPISKNIFINTVYYNTYKYVYYMFTIVIIHIECIISGHY